MSANATALAVIELTEEIASYVQQAISAIEVNGHFEETRFPAHWSLDLLSDCNRMARVITDAYDNQEKTSWSVHDYAQELKTKANGMNDAVEEALKKKFPPMNKHMTLSSSPLLITDKDGFVLVWYLPEALSPTRKKKMWNMLVKLGPAIQAPKEGDNWRTSLEHYYDLQDPQYKQGSVSMSPAWFPQAHHTAEYKLIPAKCLARDGSPAEKWLRDMQETNALLGAVLRVINPKVYEQGMADLVKISKSPDDVENHDRVKDILGFWASPYHGLSVMCNRQTPVHRDVHSPKDSMEMLATIGTYLDGQITLPSLNHMLHYPAGTIVALGGRIIPHSAKANGDRACIAYYMRETILTRLGSLKEHTWFDQNNFYD
ncbi:hypothetical protein NLJ89_g6879 [Agrocybe chaxingu]|uniref:2OGFeDO JBP1/TET oxygenase domain-containing protein n=1 Tax=Agrocybe chaxingu TaxID=84603 RepID=A0A9W8MS93_9AGAR|nr:hypothetical protein NLJ89_g6879 [Agrocybe chaxingu]